MTTAKFNKTIYNKEGKGMLMEKYISFKLK